jgi:hypothetical protein
MSEETSGQGQTIALRPQPGDATEYIQRALDECFLAGGGTVSIEPGTYSVRGLRVRSGTTLILRSGAVLVADRDCDSYDILAHDALEPVPAEEFAPDVVWEPAWKRKTNDHLLKSASRWNNAVIRIYRAHDVTIIGEPGSAIDGRDLKGLKRVPRDGQHIVGNPIDVLTGVNDCAVPYDVPVRFAKRLYASKVIGIQMVFAFPSPKKYLALYAMDFKNARNFCLQPWEGTPLQCAVVPNPTRSRRG